MPTVARRISSIAAGGIGSNLVHTAQGRDVEHVWVDGVQVIDAGRPVLADPDTILGDAQRASKALWRRARAGA
jgi:5-methylthioadenosine/S-adenosylhomocysteine deaminase